MNSGAGADDFLSRESKVNPGKPGGLSGKAPLTDAIKEDRMILRHALPCGRLLILTVAILVASEAPFLRASETTTHQARSNSRWWMIGPSPTRRFTATTRKSSATGREIFITYIRKSNPKYTAQQWRLVRSTDGGRSFATVLEKTHATSTPALETDKRGTLFSVRPDFTDGSAYLSRLTSLREKPSLTRLPGGSSGKYCTALDEPRKQLYYFAHNGSLHFVGVDGKVRRKMILLLHGKRAYLQYPHLTLGRDGTLYAAWTTQKHGKYVYRSIHAIKSTDGGFRGRRWKGAQTLELPIVDDDTGPATRVSRDDEMDVHTFLSAFMAKDGKLHFVYWSENSPQRQRYLRYDGATGKKEIDIEPLFRKRTNAKPNDSGVLVANRLKRNSTLYFVSTIEDRKRLACLASQDNGKTWREYAVSDRAFKTRVYSIGAAREITDDGWIVGTFTEVGKGAKTYFEPNSGRVYFFRIKARTVDRAPGEYRIETIAGNGQPGDTPEKGGIARDVPVDNPFGVEQGPDAALYVTTVGSHRVLRLDPKTGKITSVAGSGGRGYSGDAGPATKATLNQPYEVRFDSKGNMLIVEMQNHLIRRVDAQSGVITTVAGDGVAGYGGDDGPARQARFRDPHSITLDKNDNIYISDISNHRVRRIDAKSGRIETLAGNGKPGFPKDGGLAKDQPLITPQGIVVHNGFLWIASFRGHMVWRVGLKTGVIHRFAGTGRRGYTGDGGNPLEATFDGPRGITMSPSGVLYVVEGENNIIRAIDTVRGSIGRSREPVRRNMSMPATESRQSKPDLATARHLRESRGSLVLSDTKNHRVRRLFPDSRKP
ncbi:MAG: hypothetical protein Ct9H300mP1_38190 [Planctomycetaceae bacterium]|nr:MAG: hypothetical protein Ct9H300mP1_38190 [Planctomycetaceae bacterium]